jgi:hypothetical protein
LADSRDPRRLARAALMVLAITSCTGETGLHVVARGRYVELATDHDAPICGGTIGFYDRFIAEGFAFIGETPPDRVFVRYEWTGAVQDTETGSLVTTGGARKEGDRVVVRMNELVSEHELAHAVHLEPWPVSAVFLHEGLAVLLAEPRPFNQDRWPDGLTLDEVLVATADDLQRAYWGGWFLVSQIVVDHGVPGLRDLWHAVPRGASAQQIRATYQSLFGRSMDALVQPYVYRNEASPLDGAEIEREPCYFALCTGRELPWQGELWSASGPTDCEDDADAIGPHFSRLAPGPPVRRDYIVDREENYTFAPDPANPPASVAEMPCSLQCVMTDYVGEENSAPDEPWRHDRRVRVDVRSELEDLPTDTPVEARFLRMPR